MKYCPNCKSTCPDGQAFCTNCGMPLAEAPPPVPDEPTVQIPPVRQTAAVLDPFVNDQDQKTAAAPPPAPAKPSKAPVIVAVALAICTVLAAGGAGFFGYQALQLKKSYTAEQNLRRDAELEASDLQEELDKLRLAQDGAQQQMADLQAQLETAQDQLTDVSGQLSSGSSQLDKIQQNLNTLLSLLGKGYGFGSTSYYAAKGVVVLSQYSSETVTIYESLSGTNTFTFRVSDSGVDCTWNGSFSGGRGTVTITGNTPGYYTISFTNNTNSDSFDILVVVTE